MPIHWPTVGAEPSKRSSIFSFVSGGRATPLEEADSISPLRASIHVEASPSKKRRSLFARPTSVDLPTSTTPKRSLSTRSSRREPIMRWMNKVDSDISKRASLQHHDTGEPHAKRARISSPYAFQHLYHAEPGQLLSLDFSNDNDLGLLMSSFESDAQPEMQGLEFTGLVTSQPVSPPSQHVNASGSPRHSLPDPGRSSWSREGISRSASLASLIAEARKAPTMVHPAFRSASGLQIDSASQPNPSSSQLPSPTSADPPRNLDVVYEETEEHSRFARPASSVYDMLSPAQDSTVAIKTSHWSQSSFPLSDGQSTGQSSILGTSLASVSSLGAWDDAMDLCHTLDNSDSPLTIPWRSGKQTFSQPAPHSPFPDTSAFISNQESSNMPLSHHQRNKSSMAMTPTLMPGPLSNSGRIPIHSPSAGGFEVDKHSLAIMLPKTSTSHMGLTLPDKSLPPVPSSNTVIAADGLRRVNSASQADAPMRPALVARQSLSTNDLYKTHALPKASERFPHL